MSEDIFNHLLNIEGDAANMLFEAQVEADEKIANAKKCASAKYDEHYSAIIQKLNANFEKQRHAVDEMAERELDEYKLNIKKIPINYSAFKDKVDCYLFSRK